MKVILTLLLLCGTYVRAQSTQQDTTKQRVVIEGVTNYPPNSSSADSLKANMVFNQDVNEKIAIIDANLNSIQIKWDYIMNNPTEKLIAEEEGWFINMTEIKDSLNADKQALINSLK